ncbi:MAG TPA: HU family DNA-binding protein [Pyrinomonadaceae bacterium]|jgi:DNA-binding protein HU-beta
MAAKKGSSGSGKGGGSSKGGGGGAAKKRMTQTEIINHLADKSGMKRAAAKEFVNELANLAMSEVKKNGEFTLPGFGKLVLSERKAREGRNPATGDAIKIPAKTTLKFRVGKSMKDSIGGGK